MKFPWTNRILPFLLLFMPALTLIGAGGYFFAKSEISFQQRQLQASDAAAVDIASNALRQNLHSLSSDIEFLGNMPSTNNLKYIG